jgi:hypothetical protein
MPIQYINTGSSANAGNGDSIRLAFHKVNRNFSLIDNAIGNLEEGGFQAMNISSTLTTLNLVATGTAILNIVQAAGFQGNTNFESITVANYSTLNHVTANDIGITNTATVKVLNVSDTISLGNYQIAQINDYNDFSIIKNDAGGLSVVLLNTNANSNTKFTLQDNIGGGLVVVHDNSTDLTGDFNAGENYIYGLTPTDVLNIGAYSDIKFSASQARYYNPALPNDPSMVVQSNDGSVHIYTSATFHGDVYGIVGAGAGAGAVDRLTSQDLSKVIVLQNNGTLVPPYQPSNARIGNGKVLKIGENGFQTVIIGPSPTNTDFDAERLIIAGPDGLLAGEGGDIYLWAGRSGPNGGVSGGGDIIVEGGDGYNGSPGGNINIQAGNSNGSTLGGGGDIRIEAGLSFSSGGHGGDVLIKAGHPENTGTYGVVRIYSGEVGTWTFNETDLTSAGHILPSQDLMYDLGSTSSQWRSLYVGTSTIYLGGTALSIDGNTLTIDGEPIQTGGNSLSNLTGVGTEFVAGSEIEVALAKTVISNKVSNNLGGGGPSLTAQGIVEIDSGKAIVAHQIINTLDSETSLTSSNQIEVNSTSTRIGTQLTNTLGTSTVSAFSGWTFGTDGVLTLPSGNTRIGDISGGGMQDFIIGSTGTLLGVITQGAGGAGALQWVDNFENSGTTGTQVAAVIVNSPFASTTGTVQILTGVSTGTDSSNIWEFGTDGSLTAPGHLLPTADLAYDLGSTTTQWRSIYVGTGTIYIGGVALGVNADNYVTVDGNPIITINTAGNLTIQGDVNIGTVTVSDTAPTATTGTQWFNTVDARTYIAYNDQWVDANPTQIPSPSTYLDDIQVDGSEFLINGYSLTVDETGTLLVDGQQVTGSGAATDSITSGSYSVYVADTGVVTMATSRGNVEFGALPEPGGVSHFHIMKSSEDTGIDLFFGDDYNYVLQRGNSNSELAGHTNDYGVEIGTRDLSTGTSNQYVWRFETDGVLTLSTASTILGNGEDPNVYIETSTTATTSTWTFGTNGVLTLPADTPIIKGGGTGTDVTIVASTGTNPAVWMFEADGSLTLPIGVTIDEYYGSHFPRIVADSGKAFSLQGQGSTGSVALQWIETESTSSRIAQVGLNKFSGVAAVTLTAGTSTNDMKVWRFDETGTLALPTVGKIANGVDTAQVGSTETIATNIDGLLTGWATGSASIPYSATVIAEYPIDSTITFQDGSTAIITFWDPYGPNYIDLFWDNPKTGNIFPITLTTANYAAAITAPEWTFSSTGTLTLPVGGDIKNSSGSSVLTGVTGQETYEFDGVNTTLTITNVTFNLLFCTPASGYSGSDGHTVLLPAGTAGQRLVIVSNSNLCTLTVDGAIDGAVNVAPVGTAELIYLVSAGVTGWWPLYGTTLVT